MKPEKEIKISYWAAHLTTIVSVTLVLILVGVIALVTVSAQRETRRLREKLEVSLIMTDTVSNSSAHYLANKIASLPFAHDVNVITKEDALKSWKEDTGEDLEALFGVNPLSPEITFNVKAEYANEAQLKKISDELGSIPGVEGVVTPESEMVESMNRNIEGMAIVLGVVALVMVIISFVLINNTVHLSIYARRFTIHTMQLVGATNGFIRRPFVLGNMWAGVIAGVIASGVLAIAIVAAPKVGLDSMTLHIGWPLYACVAGGMLLTGSILCACAAAISTSRYLSKNYEDLFK